MKLTDTFLRSLKTPDKVQKLSDGGGLFLQVEPKGGKLWRLAYRFDGKQKTLAFGTYPAISLKEARKRREDAKELLAQGIDPSEAKKQAKVAIITATQEAENTFRNVALEWFKKHSVNLVDSHTKKIFSMLENKLFPYIGDMLIHQIETADLLKPIKIVEEAGRVDTAHRLVQICSQIFRYAIVVGKAKYDIAVNLRGALQTVKSKHQASITDPKELGFLLRAIDDYQGDISIIYALKILPYVFVRSSELRFARWAEFDLEAKQWLIPAERMKMKTPHVVPLATQVLTLLEELKPHSRHSVFLFSSSMSASKPISDMGLLNALRRMGYSKEEMCIHGFRGTASTMLNEMGYNFDHIERQLAHCERNAVRKAYNHAEYLPERKKMMQAWADYLDKLREGVE